jgi:hypothetical protein
LVQANGPAARQSVAHFHVHVLPRKADDQLKLNWGVKPGDHETIAAVAEKIRATLGIRWWWRIEKHVGLHITIYLTNDGDLEKAQQMAAHESPRTTKLYDRRNDVVSLDEVEKMVFWHPEARFCARSAQYPTIAMRHYPAKSRSKEPPWLLNERSGECRSYYNLMGVRTLGSADFNRVPTFKRFACGS